MAQLKDLIVTGSSRLLGKLFLTGGLDLIGDLDVNGNIKGLGSLTIDGASTLTGGVTTGAGSTSVFNGNGFTVSPTASFLEDVSVKGTLTIGQSSQTNSPGVGIKVHDLRDTTILPGTFGEKQANFYFDQVSDSFEGKAASTKWMSVLHMKGWQGEYAAWELAGNADTTSINDTLRYRQGVKGAWGDWQSVITDHNFKTYLDGTYAGLTYNNSFSGINKFAASTSFQNPSQVKFIVGDSTSAFAIGADGLQCYSDLWGADPSSTTPLTGKLFYINYYGGDVQVGSAASASNLHLYGSLSTEGTNNTGNIVTGGTQGNITANGDQGYVTGKWLRSTNHTALDGSQDIFVDSGGWLYKMTQANLAKNMLGSAGNSGNPVYFSGGKPYASIWYAGNQTVGEHNANNVTYNFTGYYTSNGPAKTLGATTDDGSLWAQAYNGTWVTQLAQDYRNGSIFVRGKNNGTWMDWKQVPSGPAGVTDKILKYTDANSIANSNIEDDGTLVTIDSDTTINGRFDVNGAGYINENNSLTISQTKGDGAGISLYGSATPQTYGIYFAQTANFGYHGGIQNTAGTDKGDWATYFGMNAISKRGWIYRAGSTNVASISANGVGSFSGGVGNGINYIAFPGGGSYTCRTSSITGALAIQLPTAVFKNCTMMNFTVNIYDYSSTGTQHHAQYHISGYNYNDGVWHQCEAYSTGDRNGVHSNLTVRFGHDGTREVIYIGETSTAWSYPQITISNLTIGYSENLYHNWTHGWNIQFLQTSAQNVTNTISNPYMGNFAGTDNQLAKFSNDGRTIIDSKISDDGTTVSANANFLVTGTSTLQKATTIQGDVTLSNSATDQGDQPGLFWKPWGANNNTPYFGFAKDQSDGTFLLSLQGENYAQGLAIGGGSGNLLWKGIRVLDKEYGDDLYLSLNGGSISGNLSITGSITAGGNITSSQTITGNVVKGAVWNDYAEYRESNVLEPGRVVVETGKGNLILASQRLQAGANIISDTFGFSIGETDNCNCPIAVSGRVLAYPLEDRNTFEAGDPVCAGPNGTVSRMTREEVREWPDRIIGTVSEIPEYSTWGTGKVKVNGRIWIKVK